MTFVRPKMQAQQDVRPDWYTMVGGADERDGRAMDALARAVQLMALSWPLLVAMRIALMLYFVGPSHVADMLSGLFIQVWLGSLILCDLAILIAPQVFRFKSQTPNRQLAVMAPLVTLSAGLYELCVLQTVADQPLTMITGTLAPAMFAMVIFGRQRLLSFSYGLGALSAIVLGMPVLGFMLPLILFCCGIALIMAFEFRISRRSSTFAYAGANRMTGEQARALLDDFESSGRGWFWETDRAGNITYVSATLARRLGSAPENMVGVPFVSLISTTEAGTQSDGERSLGFHLSARTAFSDIAVRAAHPDGEELWWSISGQPMVTPFGQYLGFRGSGSDLTEMRRSQAEIARLAKFDSLTGLANRVQMMVTLEQALAPQRGIAGECALLLLDLDRFKEVNDTMGHPAGDALLRQVAQRLQRLVGNSGKVGRLGGDEFQIVLPSMVDQHQLTKLADAIIHNVSQPYSIEGSQVVIGVSIGIALAPHDGTSAETLIRNADLALYAAKADGRGVFRFFVQAMHADAEDRRQLEQDLRTAIATGSLHLVYQPVVCAATERITGFETLIRWDHPQRGPISPALFIPIAEEAGLINQIGEWVLRTACADATHWPEGTRVAVNVSPIQFANPGLPSIVMSALANAGLSASRLELEITESVFLADVSSPDGMFNSLKNIGVRLALDDFGTGYSALGYLKTAPFDKIKIDQSFVRGAAIKGSRNAAIVKSIVSLAEALGMETTAEGAETLDELDLIRMLGCSHIQGYVYGRPASKEETLALLASSRGRATAQGHKASREPRMAMLRTVNLAHAGEVYSARIRNISKNGAMIEGLIDVPAGTIFEIELTKGYVAKGTCRWSQDDRMGIEFEEAINIERVRAPVEKEVAVTDIPHFYLDHWKQAS